VVGLGGRQINFPRVDGRDEDSTHWMNYRTGMGWGQTGG
jgi:hypothetical protein